MERKKPKRGGRHNIQVFTDVSQERSLEMMLAKRLVFQERPLKE